jgi:hypothetical protein
VLDGGELPFSNPDRSISDKGNFELFDRKLVDHKTCLKSAQENSLPLLEIEPEFSSCSFRWLVIVRSELFHQQINK